MIKYGDSDSDSDSLSSDAIHAIREATVHEDLDQVHVSGKIMIVLMVNTLDYN